MYNAIPPPMIRVSHFSSRLEITFNLSATFAPPRIATNGLSGFFYRVAEEIDLFLHQVANYRRIHQFCYTYVGAVCSVSGAKRVIYKYIAQMEAKIFGESFSVLCLLRPKRVFSRRITSPSFIASTAAFAFGPTTSGSAANFTSCPRSSDNRFATGARDSSGFGSPCRSCQGESRGLLFRRQQSVF